MNIYTSVDRTPYTYLIGWVDMDLWYYGRRTAKYCHPEELFISYFTSSKIVSDIIAEYGMPCTIRFHKIFSNVESCIIHEEKFLKRVDAARSCRWLNGTNGDMRWDGTGKIVVQDKNGKFISISVDDERYINGELFPFRKNKVAVRDEFGKNYLIDKNHQDYVNGILVPVSKGSIPWCTGLTKETDDRILQAAIKRSNTTRGKSVGPYTQSRKDNISKANIANENVWYMDGSSELLLSKNDIIPDGFIKGRSPQRRNMKLVCRVFDRKEMDMGNYTKWMKLLPSLA